MLRKTSTKRGLIRFIVILVIALLILSYFGFNLRELIDSPTTQDNFHTATSYVVNFWNEHLKTPVMYVWNDVFLKLIWNPAMEALKGNGPKTIIDSAK